jgi:hypothetical protein
LLASPTAGPSTITRHTLLSSLLCLARQQRRQPISPPAPTGYAQSALPSVCVGRLDDDRVNHYAGRASGRCPCGYPNSGCARRCGRNPMNESPAAAAKEVGMGNPAEERPPPSVTGVPNLVPVVKPLARLADLVTVPVAGGAFCLHGLNGRARWRLNQWRESLS